MTLSMKQPGPQRGESYTLTQEVAVGPRTEQGSEAPSAQGIERQSSTHEGYSDGFKQRT
jgi:hypothetical protein